MPDNRRHKRVPLTAIAKISFKDAGNVHAIEAFTADISMSGIGVYSKTAIDIDKDVTLAIEFLGNDGLSRTDSISGHAVYNNILGTTYFIGIEFSEPIIPLRQPFLYERLQRILTWG
jgi:hypothetical protein